MIKKYIKIFIVFHPVKAHQRRVVCVFSPMAQIGKAKATHSLTPLRSRPPPRHLHAVLASVGSVRVPPRRRPCWGTRRRLRAPRRIPSSDSTVARTSAEQELPPIVATSSLPCTFSSSRRTPWRSTSTPCATSPRTTSASSPQLRYVNYVSCDVRIIILRCNCVIACLACDWR
jgi:hypothetical protein